MSKYRHQPATAIGPQRAHSTPDPDQPPQPDDDPQPDERPQPQHAPIEEPQPKPHPVQAHAGENP
ncbi:hypothetical protein [Duganella qianjiadongensis]|uniref:Uncharacterized protein n=1 Tax=Duganella qianjiadongensis TaxID=2692176 RepID=A0ABW9VFA0_9BURK|nr:hypothetical protein [Duganella qianjiadongensis]MYM38133.1 hypothetical protein [Duganella qianjiadongensis]